MQKFSDRWFLELYLKYGSVEEAMKSYPENLPISVANYHRLVKKYGLVVSAGRHVSLPETLHFFRQKAFEPGTPLERLYRKMPPSFQTSLSTLHRIYQYMERQLVRRYAAALVISKETDRNSVLVGSEVFDNSRYGKKVGDISIPMGFAKKEETHFESALRVLQQEVFARAASCGQLREKSELVSQILPRATEPFAYFDIVDVRVKIIELKLPVGLSEDFSSFKLINHRFQQIADLKSLQLRTGVSEILDIYQEHLCGSAIASFPAHYVSHINTLLAYEQAL